MVKIAKIEAAPGVMYLDEPQGSPEWVQVRKGRPSSSRMKDWMAVSKRPNKEGVHTPLKARLDYEKELNYELTFNVVLERFVNGAMKAGIEAEEGIRRQYEAILGKPIEKCGVFYDKYSASSPDGLIGDDEGFEAKYLWDSNFAEVLLTGKPLEEHYYQIQDGLRMTGRKRWHYVVANANTGKMKAIIVERDEELIEQIAEAVKDVSWVKPIETKNVFDYQVDEAVTAINEEW